MISWWFLLSWLGCDPKTDQLCCATRHKTTPVTTPSQLGWVYWCVSTKFKLNDILLVLSASTMSSTPLFLRPWSSIPQHVSTMTTKDFELFAIAKLEIPEIWVGNGNGITPKPFLKNQIYIAIVGLRRSHFGPVTKSFSCIKKSYSMKRHHISSPQRWIKLGD